MLRRGFKLLLTLLAFSFPIESFADDWSLDNDSSRLSFGSIKKASVGESHYFTHLKGTVLSTGQAKVQVDLASVQTGVDIRDERLEEHVFKTALWPEAVISLNVDIKAATALKLGQTMVIEDADTTITIAGVESEITSSLVVTRLSKNRIMVQPDVVIMMDGEDFGLESGVEVLREIMELSSISTAIPVSYRFVFMRQ